MREDWTLLSVAAAKKSLSPMQLQRSLFLLGQRFPDLTRNFYVFRPVGSGQFSEEVYADAEKLATEGLVTVDHPTGEPRGYGASASGIERARLLEKHAGAEEIQFLRRTVAWVRTRSNDQLVRGPLEPAGPQGPLRPKSPFLSRG